MKSDMVKPMPARAPARPAGAGISIRFGRNIKPDRSGCSGDESERFADHQGHGGTGDQRRMSIEYVRVYFNTSVTQGE